MRGDTMKRFQKYYLRFAGVTFLITGVAKLISAFGTSGIHDLPDPIFGITIARLMLLAGIVECLLALMSIFIHKIYMTGAVTAFSAFLLFYRLGLWWIGWRRPCHCLGELTDILHLSGHVADLALRLILAFLLAGGCFCLVFNRHENDRPACLP